jgi:hypothetical protein
LNQDRILKAVLIGTNPPGENLVPFDPAFFQRALKPVNDLKMKQSHFLNLPIKKQEAAKQSFDRIAKDWTAQKFHQPKTNSKNTLTVLQR